jgi:DNA-binding MarR family transcriptional regulator
MDIQLNDLLCYQLFELVKLNTQQIDTRMKPLSLSRTQWKILSRFPYLGEPCSQQSLLRSMDIDRAHLTRSLYQLERRGLITRTRQAKDRRAFNISLTANGLTMRNWVGQVLSENDTGLLDTLTASESTELLRLIQKISNRHP